MDRRDAVRERLDVRHLAEQLGVEVRTRSATRWVAKCFNKAAHKNGDRNPSLALYADGYHCHGCGEHGDMFDLWRWARGGTFPEALDALASQAGLDVPDGRRSGPARPAMPPAVRTQPEAPQCVLTDRRREIWRNIWAIVRNQHLPHAARTWLRARGLRSDAAQGHGCRDWSTAASELVQYFSALSLEDCVEAGLVNADGRKWAPLKALDGAVEYAGLAVPLWHPDEPEAPVGVRWRYYGKPWPDAPKSMAQPRGAFSWTVAGRPMPLERSQDMEGWTKAFPFAQGGWPAVKGEDDPPTAVLLLEGETDWLAVASCLVDRQTPWRVIPLALCAMSGRPWPDVLTPLVAGADRIICLFDEGRNPDKPAGVQASRAVAESLVRQIGRDETRRRFVAWPLPDDDDAADHNKRGELWPLIQKLLEGQDDG